MGPGGLLIDPTKSMRLRTPEPRLPDAARYPTLRPITVYRVNESDFGGPATKQPNKHSSRVWGPCITEGLLEDLLETLRLWSHYHFALDSAWRTGFRNSHLTTIQEILALGCWPAAANPVPRHRTGNGSHDVDWRFMVADREVLMEVKFRRTDWRRGHPETETYNHDLLFAGIAEKFPQPTTQQVNVAHVVIIGEIDEIVRVAAQRFACDPSISAVVLDGLQNGGIEIFGREAAWVECQCRRSRTFRRPEVMPIYFARPVMRDRFESEIEKP
jgi:hypothetical protein